MATARDVQCWVDALRLFDEGKIGESVAVFKTVSPSARIAFNIACCCLRIDESLKASQKFYEVLQMDAHFVLPYFMLGHISYTQGRYAESLEFYGETFKKLRGNRFVDYRPLGLNYFLYASLVLANQGKTLYKLGRDSEAELTFAKAKKLAVDVKQSELVTSFKATCLTDDPSMFALPESFLFRPSQKSVNNVKKKNYLGHATTIADDCKERKPTAKPPDRPPYPSVISLNTRSPALANKKLSLENTRPVTVTSKNSPKPCRPPPFSKVKPPISLKKSLPSFDTYPRTTQPRKPLPEF